ncbi:MAG TPA: Druantia anti-phage system protein DruA [Longimicrobium sp.]
MRRLPGPHADHLRVLVGILCDLRAMGWCYYVEDGVVCTRPPDATALAPEAFKDFVRTGHLIERDAQLAQPATRAFVQSMERRRLGPTGWHSIFSLIRDGRTLARELERAGSLPPGLERSAAVSAVIRPYVQVARRGEHCRFTGLDLSQIWRYFRHTWTTVYQSTPGRNLAFLIRDAAAPNHPVIGIGALGSSIVQLRVRDTWIGWSAENFLQAVREDPKSWARWALRALDDLIGDVYCADLAAEGVLTAEQIAEPDLAVLARLRGLSEEARRDHRLFPQLDEHKKVQDDTDWEARARTHLFRYKRARALADLLAIRFYLREAGLRRARGPDLERALAHPRGVRALLGILRRVKAKHVGVNMMDITVCGAVAPYNALLGGKLVSLLMASSEVVRAYADQYRNTPSVIASAMAGRPVRRDPELVLLGTTSLYGNAPSQYNRVRMPAEAAEGTPGAEIQYERLGQTTGFGSYHFSAETVEAMEILLARNHRGREVNSIFGEGVNPKLRKVRAALDEIGLPSDLLLQHGQPRVVYGIPLAGELPRGALRTRATGRLPAAAPRSHRRGHRPVLDRAMAWQADRRPPSAR